MTPLGRSGRAVEVKDQIRNMPPQLGHHLPEMWVGVSILTHQPVFQTRGDLIALPRFDQREKLLMPVPLMGVPQGQRVGKTHRQLGDLLFLLC